MRLLIRKLHFFFCFRVTHKNIGKTRFHCTAESKWCPPCHDNGGNSNDDGIVQKCVFNGTLFHISDIRARIKRDINLQNESSITLPLRIFDQRQKPPNLVSVSLRFFLKKNPVQTCPILLLTDSWYCTHGFAVLGDYFAPTSKCSWTHDQARRRFVFAEGRRESIDAHCDARI